MRFAKAHAYGNDFLYVEAHALGDAAPAALARRMCDRHAGVGADGLIVYQRTAAGVSMRLFNADGGEAEVSGNGVRALAALILHDSGATGAELVVETVAGAKRVTSLSRTGSRHTFRASMGQPKDVRVTSCTVGGETFDAVTLNIGNPHCVVLGALPDDRRFERIGAGLQGQPAFPGGTNVEFAHVETPDRVRIRIWERGVGPTSSSGTGSCAALVAAAAVGGASREADVIAPGGAQRVEWREDGVYLTGWAEVLCVGDWVAGATT